MNKETKQSKLLNCKAYVLKVRSYNYRSNIKTEGKREGGEERRGDTELKGQIIKNKEIKI